MTSKDRAEPPPGSGKKAGADSGDRDSRLAAALRQNLRRRKAQHAARQAGEAGSPTGRDPERESS